MSIREDQFLPNDCTFQLKYKPNAHVLDHRGDWAMSLAEDMGLSEWGIIENRFDVFDNPMTVQATVAFNFCAFFCVDVPEYSNFSGRISRFLKFLFLRPKFGDFVHPERIGVRLRFCTPYSGSFEQLKDHIRDRYVDLKPEAYIAIEASNRSVRLSDQGAPFYFKDDHGEFHTHCGVMERKQLKEQYFKNRDENDLPAIGLYYDIDYFLRPEKKMNLEEITSTIEKFCSEGWNRHQRIRKLIVKG